MKPVQALNPMPYDTYIADRIRRFLEKHKADFFEKTMFGGLCFMVDNKMFCGVHFDKKKDTDLLMARIGEDAAPVMLKRKGCHPMDFTGRPMKGYMFVTPDGYDSDAELEQVLELCLAFNPLAKASKKG